MAKILIIEDDISLRSRLCDAFNASGFVVLSAKDGEEGLATALNEHPDILLLDVVLPKIHGLNVLKKLREDQWGKNATVIILTNLSDSETVAKGMTEGAYNFLIKGEQSIDDVVREVRKKLQENSENSTDE